METSTRNPGLEYVCSFNHNFGLSQTNIRKGVSESLVNYVCHTVYDSGDGAPLNTPPVGEEGNGRVGVALSSSLRPYPTLPSCNPPSPLRYLEGASDPSPPLLSGDHGWTLTRADTGEGVSRGPSRSGNWPPYAGWFLGPVGIVSGESL